MFLARSALRSYGFFCCMLIAVVVSLSDSRISRGDDDDGWVPPTNPGPGYGGISGRPPLPPGYVPDRTTSPSGVASIYNIGDQTGDTELWTRQRFRPSMNSVDWVAFVFQNSEQPNDADYIPNDPGTPDDDLLGGGAGTVSISLWENMSLTQNLTQGTLSGLLGTTNIHTIAERTIGWKVFTFPETIELVPGRDYFLSIDISSGYSIDIGGTWSNVNSNFQPHNYWYHEFVPIHGYPQSLYSSSSHEFVFAEGIIIDPPPGDFDGDYDVDGRDFLAWQREGVSAAELELWQTNYGTTASAVAFAVPECSTVIFVMMIGFPSITRIAR